MAKLGRKRKLVNEEELANLARHQWPVTALAAHFKVDKCLLHRHYATLIDDARHTGVANLLDAAWFQAKAGKWEALKYLLDRFLPQTIPQAPSEIQVNVLQQNITVEKPASISKGKILQLYEALLEEEPKVIS